MRPTVTLAIVLAVLLLAACGGSDDDSTPTGPDVLDISGAWSFRTTDVTGDGVTCSQSGSTMTVDQSGASFTGEISGGTVECEIENGFFSRDVGSDRIANGSIDGTAVEFELEAVFPGTSFQGTASASAMSGTVTELVFNQTGGIDTLTGSWSAER